MTGAQIAAIAGEHFVAHRIAMLGFAPTLVRQSIPGVDLLVSAGKGSRTIAIQVRSAFSATREVTNERGTTFYLRFPLGHRAVAAAAKAAFFCFVDLRQQVPITLPDVYIVPAAVLRKEYDGVYLRKYAQVHHDRPWQTMQPFRNNWAPLVAALKATDTTAPTERRLGLRPQNEFARHRWAPSVSPSIQNYLALFAPLAQ